MPGYCMWGFMISISNGEITSWGLPSTPPVELSSDDFPTHVATLFGRLTAIMAPLMRPFEADAQERAFVCRAGSDQWSENSDQSPIVATFEN